MKVLQSLIISLIIQRARLNEFDYFLKEFLDAFRNIKDNLDGVCDSIGSMSECSDNMLSRLKVNFKNQIKF